MEGWRERRLGARSRSFLLLLAFPFLCRCLVKGHYLGLLGIDLHPRFFTPSLAFVQHMLEFICTGGEKA